MNGAGDGGERAVRELLNNAMLGLHPFCFLDDDQLKHGECIHGLPVFGGFACDRCGRTGTRKWPSVPAVAEEVSVRPIVRVAAGGS